MARIQPLRHVTFVRGSATVSERPSLYALPDCDYKPRASWQPPRVSLPAPITPDTRTLQTSAAGASCVETRTQGHCEPLPPTMSTPTATVTFQVECHTRLGDTVRVTGNCPELGDWDPAAGLALATTAEAYPTWTASVELPLHVALEFKFVRAVASGGYEWECPYLDANRFTCVLPSATSVQVRHAGGLPLWVWLWGGGFVCDVRTVAHQLCRANSAG